MSSCIEDLKFYNLNKKCSKCGTRCLKSKFYESKAKNDGLN